MLLLCLSASRIYKTFSISTRSRKKQLGSCSISFLVHPGRIPGIFFMRPSKGGSGVALSLVFDAGRRLFRWGKCRCRFFARKANVAVGISIFAMQNR